MGLSLSLGNGETSQSHPEFCWYTICRQGGIRLLHWKLLTWLDWFVQCHRSGLLMLIAGSLQHGMIIKLIVGFMGPVWVLLWTEGSPAPEKKTERRTTHVWHLLTIACMQLSFYQTHRDLFGLLTVPELHLTQLGPTFQDVWKWSKPTTIVGAGTLVFGRCLSKICGNKHIVRSFIPIWGWCLSIWLSILHLASGFLGMDVLPFLH